MKEEKVVLITGASKGIGQKIVERLAKENLKIIACYNKSEQEMKNLQQKIKKNEQKEIEIIQGDLSKEEEIQKMIATIDQKYPRVDILINNAGIAIDKRVEEKTVEAFQKVLSVNLLAPFLLSQHFGKKMYERKQGKIINITSTNGIDTMYPEGMDYDASKAGLISLTHNFAKAYAPYVQVNAIAPGWVNTPMNEEMDEEYKKQEESKILLGRFAHPEEIAEVVAFLVSDGSTYINSSIIRVDGGVK